MFRNSETYATYYIPVIVLYIPHSYSELCFIFSKLHIGPSDHKQHTCYNSLRAPPLSPSVPVFNITQYCTFYMTSNRTYSSIFSTLTLANRTPHTHSHPPTLLRKPVTQVTRDTTLRHHVTG